MQNRQAIAEALRFEGAPSEVARGYVLILWLVFERQCQSGRDKVKISEREMEQVLNFTRKTLRAWAKAGEPWGILRRDGSTWWIDWRPALLRVRAAAVAGRIADVPLFQPLPQSGVTITPPWGNDYPKSGVVVTPKNENFAGGERGGSALTAR